MRRTRLSLLATAADDGVDRFLQVGTGGVVDLTGKLTTAERGRTGLQTLLFAR
jgi:hypothetical protein